MSSNREGAAGARPEREGAVLSALVGALVTGKLAAATAIVGLVVAAMVLAWPRSDQVPLSQAPN